MPSRRKRGALDPDYRTKLWRNSKYAPKNSSPTLSSEALMFTSVIIFPIYLIALNHPELKRILWSLNGIIAGLVIGFFLWLIIARGMLKRERQRLLKLEAEAAAKVKPTRPTKSPWERPQEAFAPPEPITYVYDSVNRPKPASPSRYKEVSKPQQAQTLTPRDFEHEVAWVFNTLTPYKAIVNGGAGDGGIDIKIINNNRLFAIVQCKRYDASKALPPQFVRELAAVRQRAQVGTAYLVTTAYFSDATRAEAKQFGIRLIDGQKFAEMRERARIITRQYTAVTPDDPHAAFKRSQS
jgi:HJR/Mrr/RecB family endonuclease